MWQPPLSRDREIESTFSLLRGSVLSVVSYLYRILNREKSTEVGFGGLIVLTKLAFSPRAVGV